MSEHSGVRIERDSMGEVRVPRDALYGAQTQRAVENFPLSHVPMPRPFIRALGLIKATAATVNADLGLLDAATASAIENAAMEVAAGRHDGDFPVDVYQTGSGTSSNMNANEVIATLAARALGRSVHPNDHVNRSQSSNDVIPSAIHVSAALELAERLYPALEHLAMTIEARAGTFGALVKTGRTHLMDAMPLTLQQELGGWASQVRSGIARLQSVSPRLHALAQGGTAVGTGVNAHREFPTRFAAALSARTGHPFTSAPDKFEAMSSQDTALELSGQLNVLASSLMKIANDLRWMNSGPLAGLGEIVLPALQPGSSIMPGKVNPVIPESVAMVCARIMGSHVTITVAGQSGSFQLNVMLPLIASELLTGIGLAANAAQALADSAIRDMSVNVDGIARPLALNPILVTALNEIIGYEAGAEIAKRAYLERRPVVDVAAELTDLPREELERVLDPTALTRPIPGSDGC